MLSWITGISASGNIGLSTDQAPRSSPHSLTSRPSGADKRRLTIKLIARAAAGSPDAGYCWSNSSCGFHQNHEWFWVASWPSATSRSSANALKCTKSAAPVISVPNLAPSACQLRRYSLSPIAFSGTAVTQKQHRHTLGFFQRDHLPSAAASSVGDHDQSCKGLIEKSLLNENCRMGRLPPKQNRVGNHTVEIVDSSSWCLQKI